ncbi:SDR family oxidoreductase [Aquirufa sp. ROCK2-A2]
MKFLNKTVWITGASSGIGEALAIQFAKEGAQLILSARRENELNRVATMCQNLGAKTLVLAFDMTHLDQHAEMVYQAKQFTNQIDVIVLNAGVSQRSFVLDTQFDVYRKLFEINFFSIVSLTQHILPIFQSQKSGIFVPIASVAGRISTPRRAAYGASKHALIGFFDSVRAEVYNFGIQVTTILPGYIKTDISLNAMNEKGEKYAKMDPNQAKGLDPNQTAEKIVAAIYQGKKEYFVGGNLEALGLFVKRFFPNLLFYMIRKVKNT